MNLMERDPRKAGEDQHNLERENNINKEEKENLQDLLHKPYMTPVLLGIIAVLLICIIVLLLLFSMRSHETQTDAGDRLQQSITDYAKEQKQNDYVPGLSGEAVLTGSGNEETTESVSGQSVPESGAEDGTVSGDLVANDSGKEPIVVEEEDENDVSYSKEFILNEALPYFVNNNHPAISDLAHLKRYVKLSAELKGTNQYYYIGDVNGAGRPDGKGLAIYEDNSYYYGDWSDGTREGTGRWFRFYINEKSRRNAEGAYTSHSYAGEWANDLPNGEGAEHYDVDTTRLASGKRIIQNVVGGFSDGLYDGDMFANTVNSYGNVEEWDGSAVKGTFELWTDMSAIGECSVWRNKPDETLYMDIDKSENKSQGIRELLKTDKSKDAE